MQKNTEDLIQKIQKSINIFHNPKAGWFILALSLLITFLAYWMSSRQVQIRAEERFEFRAEEITNAIYERMAMYGQALQGASGLFSASTAVSREEWRAYAESLELSQRLPGIQGLGYAVVVGSLDEHIKEVRSQGFPDYSVKPGGQRDFYSSIVYLEPFDWRNRRAFGYDMWSNNLRQKAMARARDEGGLATSGMITLVQETDENVQRGFLTYIPVYKTKGVPNTIRGRREALQGWVYAAFRVEDLMSGILGTRDKGISFEIYDGDERRESTLFFDSDDEPSLEGVDRNLLFMTKKLTLNGQAWTVYFSTTRDMLFNPSEAEQPKYILIAGILIDLLLFYVIFSLYFVNRNINTRAQELNQEFEINQQGLIMQARLLEAAQKESETFFEMAPEAFLVVSKSGVVVRANKYAHGLLGFEGGGLLNVQLEDLVPNVAKQSHSKLRNEYFKRPISRAMGGNKHLTARKRDGSLVSVTINLEPIDFLGEMHVVAAVHDVTSQKQLEKTLADAKEKAESASRSKSDFVANMSHEIRTPLNAVIGAAQLLGKTSPNTLQGKYINMIRSSGEALLGVINDILDFSKIEAGCMELSTASFDLSDVLSKVGLMMSMNVGEKDLELVIHVDLDVCCHMVGDPLRLQQVLINLASNAIKFTDHGTVTLAVNALSCDDGLQRLKFSISDTGIGMTQAQQTKLFNAFTQADESITRRFGGTGLGLVISNQLVKLMGAQIRVSSEQGKGTVFSFTVELPIDEEQPRLEQVDDLGLKVLVIDSGLQTCSAIRELLGAWGISSWVFPSWSEALPAIAGTALIKELDLVLLDWQVSSGDDVQKLSGAEVLEKLRAMGLKDSCSSILISSSSQRASLLVDGMQKEFDSGLVKPILRRTLLEAIHEACLGRTGQGVMSQSCEQVQSAGRINGVRILLVEDNIFNQTIAQGLLEDMGAHIFTVDNGAEAITCYREDPGRFDIILMDIQMPVMDGLTATKILREEFTCQLPIIAMTAGVLQSEREKYLSGGMDDFVAKPIDEKELFAAVYRGLVVERDSEEGGKSVKTVTKPPSEAAQEFNSARLELLSKGKSNRVRSIIDSIDSLALNGEQSLIAGWKAVEDKDKDQALILFHGFKGQVANYGGEVLSLSIQSLEQGLREGLPVKEVQPLFSLVIHNYHKYIQLALEWKQKQKKLFEEE